MNSLLDIMPHVRYAAQYTYSGTPAEAMRQGSNYAFHLFWDSKGAVMVDDVIYPVEKGTLFFIRPGQSHSFHFSQESCSMSYNIYVDLWVREPDTSLFPQFIFYPDRMPDRLMTPRLPCAELDGLPVRSSLRSAPHLEELFIQINKTYDMIADIGFRNKLLGSMMISWILQWYHFQLSSPPSDFRILRIIEEMERHPERHMAYDQLCGMCGLEKSYFYKLFKRETGMTPKNYLLKIKMKKAGSMLLESNQSITSVAEELGYDSIHYFTKQFKAFHGVTPSAFRKQ